VFCFSKCPAICRGQIPLNSFALHFGFQNTLLFVCLFVEDRFHWTRESHQQCSAQGHDLDIKNWIKKSQNVLVWLRKLVLAPAYLHSLRWLVNKRRYNGVHLQKKKSVINMM
jgi:hypothetical protein